MESCPHPNKFGGAYCPDGPEHVEHQLPESSSSRVLSHMEENVKLEKNEESDHWLTFKQMAWISSSRGYTNPNAFKHEQFQYISF